MKLETKKQEGSVIIIAMLAIFTLLVIGAALFFIGRYHVAKTQADGHARNIAITALKNYYTSKPECESLHPGNAAQVKRCRLQNADDSIRLATGGLAAHNQLIADPNVADRAEFAAAIKGTAAMQAGNSNVEGAYLSPGRWTQKEADCGGPSKTPCFIDFALNSNGNIDTAKFQTFLTTNQEPNAFRVSGRLFPRGVLNLFGNFLGVDSLPVSVNATSAVVPKRGCFMVDVSNSTTYLSHANFGANYVKSPCPNPLLPIGYVDTNNYWSDQVQSTISQYCCPNAAANEFGNYFAYPLNFSPAGNPDITGLYSAEMSRPDISYSCMSKNLSTRPNTPISNPYYHFRNDYHKIYALKDSDRDPVRHKNHPTATDYPLGTGTANAKAMDAYWVDTYSDPQPLTIIFNGLKAAMEEFKSRAGEGSDKACIIFFDQDLVWPRMIKPTDAWDELIKFTDIRKNISSQSVLNNGENNDPGSYVKATSLGFEKLARHGLFPNFAGKYTAGMFKPRAFTYTVGAIEAALTLFAQDSANSGIPTADFLVLITDGLTNCTSNNECSNTYIKYMAAIAKLKNYVNANLVPQGIPLHVILAGEHVKPATRCIKKIANDPSSPCFTDAEWRGLSSEQRVTYSTNLNYFVEGDLTGSMTIPQRDQRFQNASAQYPFNRVNLDYYDMAVKTQGFFVPIRPQGTGCTPGVARNFSHGSIVAVDPFCRDYATQVKEALVDIVRFTPYAVVDVK